MTFKFDGYNWLVRLEKGELLIEQLTEFVKQQQVTSAWLNSIGAAMWAETGFYELDKKQYIWEKLEGPLEILSLQGNVAWENDEPILHIHGTFSKADMQAFGGHLKELEVAATCEVLLHRWYKDGLSRSYDDQTGLKLLDL